LIEQNNRRRRRKRRARTRRRRLSRERNKLCILSIFLCATVKVDVFSIFYVLSFLEL
jgi:hypothetical protein